MGWAHCETCQGEGRICAHCRTPVKRGQYSEGARNWCRKCRRGFAPDGVRKAAEGWDISEAITCPQHTATVITCDLCVRVAKDGTPEFGTFNPRTINGVWPHRRLLVCQECQLAVRVAIEDRIALPVAEKLNRGQSQLLVVERSAIEEIVTFAQVALRELEELRANPVGAVLGQDRRDWGAVTARSQRVDQLRLEALGGLGLSEKEAFAAVRTGNTNRRGRPLFREVQGPLVAGADLDALAAEVGITRGPGETDPELRVRALAAHQATVRIGLGDLDEDEREAFAEEPEVDADTGHQVLLCGAVGPDHRTRCTLERGHGLRDSQGRLIYGVQHREHRNAGEPGGNGIAWWLPFWAGSPEQHEDFWNRHWVVIECDCQGQVPGHERIGDVTPSAPPSTECGLERLGSEESVEMAIARGRDMRERWGEPDAHPASVAELEGPWRAIRIDGIGTGSVRVTLQELRQNPGAPVQTIQVPAVEVSPGRFRLQPVIGAATPEWLEGLSGSEVTIR